MQTSAIAADNDLASSLRAHAVAELTRAIDYLKWRGARAHEGVHQARKSMRRVRSTLRLGGTDLGLLSRILQRAIQRMSRSLSPLRDAQALVETLDGLIRACTSDDERRLLRRARRVAANARTATMRTVLANDPGFGSIRATLESLTAGIQELPWGRVSPDGIRSAIAGSAMAAREAAQRAQVSGDDGDWHRWRRQARRFSQQEHVLVDLVVLAAARPGGKAVAVLLGKAQDFTLLRERCDANSLFSWTDRLALLALAKNHSSRLRGKIAEVLLLTPAFNALSDQTGDAFSLPTQRAPHIEVSAPFRGQP